MTCIVGAIDRDNDCVWIGGDSLGSNGYTKAVETNSKVFKNIHIDEIVFGSTSTFRHIDLLRYSEDVFSELDKYKGVKIDHKYMVMNFIPNIINLFKEGIINESDVNKGGNFIVGAKDKLYEIQSDYSVLEPRVGYVAVGSGEDIAMGSMITTEEMDLTIPKRIELALKSAERYSCTVQRPFKIINTMNDEEIVIE